MSPVLSVYAINSLRVFPIVLSYIFHVSSVKPVTVSNEGFIRIFGPPLYSWILARFNLVKNN